MRGTPQGRTAYAEADVLKDDILQLPQVRATLNLEEPVALSLVALLHFVPDASDPYGLVRGLLDGLAPGSYLVLSHATEGFAREDLRELGEMYQRKGIDGKLRSRTEVARFFDGLDLLDPGVVVGHRWRPDEEPRLPDAEVGFYVGVGRRP